MAGTQPAARGLQTLPALPACFLVPPTSAALLPALRPCDDVGSRGGARRPPPPPSSRQARRRARPRSASATTTTMTTTTTRRARPSRRPPPSTASSRSRSSRCYFTYATAPQLVAATHLRSCSHPQEHPKETAPTLGYTEVTHSRAGAPAPQRPATRGCQGRARRALRRPRAVRPPSPPAAASTPPAP